MTILLNNLKRIFQNKMNIVLMIVVPIVVNLFIISASTKEVNYTIGIQDNDNSQYTQDLIEYLGEMCNIIEITDEDNIKEMLVNSKINCVLVMEEHFTEDLLNQVDVKIKSYGMEGSNVVEPFQNYVDSLVTAAKKISIAAAGDETAFYEGLDDYYKQDYVCDYNSISQSYDEKVSLAVTSLGYIALGMVFFLSFSTMLILEDKLCGVYDRLGTTPLRKLSYFVQHLLSSFIVALIQIFAMLIILPKIVDVSYGQTQSDVMQLGVVCALFAACCISIGIVIARFAKSRGVANAAITLINLPMLMLGGCLWPREIMPEHIQKIGEFLPTTWFLDASETVLYGDGLAKAGNSIFYMLGFIAVMLIISFVIKTDKVK